MRFYIDKILTHAFKFYEQKIVDKVNKMFKIASEQKSKNKKQTEEEREMVKEMVKVACLRKSGRAGRK